jgi:hypothetical protein
MLLLFWCKGPIIKPATDSSPLLFPFPGTLYDGKQYYKGGGKAKLQWWP